MRLPLVIVESRYASKTADGLIRNWNYLKFAIADSISKGEVPFASHGFFTQMLNDRSPEARKLGLRLAIEYIRRADYMAIYLDYGWSRGMRLGARVATRFDIPVVERKIGRLDRWQKSSTLLKTIQPGPARMQSSVISAKSGT